MSNEVEPVTVAEIQRRASERWLAQQGGSTAPAYGRALIDELAEVSPAIADGVDRLTHGRILDAQGPDDPIAESAHRYLTEQSVRARVAVDDAILPPPRWRQQVALSDLQAEQARRQADRSRTATTWAEVRQRAGGDVSLQDLRRMQQLSRDGIPPAPDWREQISRAPDPG